MDQKTIEFWDKSVSRMFWLGMAIMAGITVNSLVRYWAASPDASERPKRDQEGEPESADETGNRRKSSKTKKVAFADEEKPIVDIQRLKSPQLGSASDSLPNRRKNSVDNLGGLKSRPTNAYKIVFTGGPCAGKTTAITYCAEKLRELGFSAICVPEAATMIFSSGGVLNMTTYTPYQGIEFQKALMKLQISLEDIFTKIVTINNSSSVCFVLCDRGLMDGSAYLSKEQWEVLLNESGLYEQDIKEDRYDLVIHLTTAADGAPDHYHCENNAARDEGISTAIQLDRKIRDAWSNHPNYFLVTNDVADFESKIREAYGYIMLTQGFPVETSFSIKLLMREDGAIFDKIVRRYKLDVFNITDTFLDKNNYDQLATPVPDKSANSDRVIYIRRRVGSLYAGTQLEADLPQRRPVLQGRRVELLGQAQHPLEGVQLVLGHVQVEQPHRDQSQDHRAHPRHLPPAGQVRPRRRLLHHRHRAELRRLHRQTQSRADGHSQTALAADLHRQPGRRHHQYAWLTRPKNLQDREHRRSPMVPAFGPLGKAEGGGRDSEEETEL